MLTNRAIFVLVLAAFAVPALALPLLAGPLEGRAAVIDGDTLEIAGQHVRLSGIDAPELRQTCTGAGGEWACGPWASERLADWIGHRTVRCAGQGRDRYGRVLATCEVGGADIGRWLVRSGLAIAYRRYSDAYVGDEAAASAARLGIWSGQMDSPERVRHPQAAGPSGSCAIKGNVSDRGRIYHRPGQRDYDRTRISQPGEQWFCSTAEAESAGFRPARR